MKIIERREAPDERIGRFRCNVCHSVIETERDDVPAMKFHGGTGVRDEDYWSIRCPICRALIALLSSQALTSGEDHHADNQ